MSRVIRVLLVLTSLALGLFVAGAPTASAKHIASHQCGVKSSSFARICRPSAYVSCMGAVKRGVAGFSARLCEQRKSACSRCLSNIHACISRIGHWPKLTHNCDRCKARFDTCMKRLYPEKQ